MSSYSPEPQTGLVLGTSNFDAGFTVLDFHGITALQWRVTQ